MSGSEHSGPKLILALVVAAFSGGFLSSILSYFWFEPGRTAELRKREQLEKLVSPVVTNLKRTKVAYERFKAKPDFGHARWLHDGNVRVRKILLEQSHLTPEDISDDAVCLIVHYDAWINRYEDLLERTEPKPNPSSEFSMKLADMSHKDNCSEFPDDAEKAFVKKRRDLSRELGIQ